MPRPNDETYKNRHVPHKKEEKSIYTYPNSDNNLKKFCSVEDILKEFVPVNEEENPKENKV